MTFKFEDLPDQIAKLTDELYSLKAIIVNQGKAEPKESGDKLVQVPGASQILGISKSSIYRKIKTGEIKSHFQHGRHYFKKSELLAFLDPEETKTKSVLNAFKTKKQ